MPISVYPPPWARPAAVAAVMVTYNPEVERLKAALSAISPQVKRVIVVDNGSDQPWWQGATWPANLQVMAVGKNLGIGAAQNLGARRAWRLQADFVLLLDHDSVCSPQMVEKLCRAWNEHSQPQIASGSAAGPTAELGAVGAVGLDQRQGGSADVLVYTAQRFGPRRIRPQQWQENVAPVAFLVASGSLISRRAWQQVGPMRGGWFIDHIDLEWGLRAQQKGFCLLAVRDATFDHQLGDETVKIPGRKQVVHLHSPFRVYFLTRNTLWLLRCGLLNRYWAWGYLVWLAKYDAFNLVFAPARTRRAWAIMRAWKDGLLGEVPRA